MKNNKEKPQWTHKSFARERGHSFSSQVTHEPDQQKEKHASLRQENTNGMDDILHQEQPPGTTHG